VTGQERVGSDQNQWVLVAVSPPWKPAVRAYRRASSVAGKPETSVRVLPFGVIVSRATYRLGGVVEKRQERFVSLPQTTLQTVWINLPPRSFN
jgi:hypothetical protein